VAAGEWSVLLTPVETAPLARARVAALDDALRDAGLRPAIGWALRLSGHGLFHAAARADAARLGGPAHGRPGIRVDEGIAEREADGAAPDAG
jgi:hypothetical protein